MSYISIEIKKISITRFKICDLIFMSFKFRQPKQWSPSSGTAFISCIYDLKFDVLLLFSQPTFVSMISTKTISFPINSINYRHLKRRRSCSVVFRSTVRRNIKGLHNVIYAHTITTYSSILSILALKRSSLIYDTQK